MQSIATFSLAIPILILLILLVLVSVVKSFIIGDFEKNKVSLAQEQAQTIQLEAIKKENSTQQELLQNWKNLLDGDSFDKISTQIGPILQKNNKTKTLLLTEQTKVLSKRDSIASKHTDCAFSFQGTFSELQKSMLELEHRNPQLMVNTLRIRPQSSSNLLNLKVNYTIWEN